MRSCDLDRSIIRVGDGRGFVVAGEREDDRLVITAAHCLPFFPRCEPISSHGERTYQAVLGTLGQEPKIWAECLFVELVADIAVLGPAEHEDLSKEHVRYCEMLDDLIAFSIGEAPGTGSARMFSLQKTWFSSKVERVHDGLWISDATESIKGGMSGSPICLDEGRAIGVVCTASSGAGVNYTEGGPNPVLTSNLPGWLLRETIRGATLGELRRRSRERRPDRRR